MSSLEKYQTESWKRFTVELTRVEFRNIWYSKILLIWHFIGDSFTYGLVCSRSIALNWHFWTLQKTAQRLRQRTHTPYGTRRDGKKDGLEDNIGRSLGRLHGSPCCISTQSQWLFLRWQRMLIRGWRHFPPASGCSVCTTWCVTCCCCSTTTWIRWSCTWNEDYFGLFWSQSLKNLILNLGGETGATLQRGKGSHQYHLENCFEAIYPYQRQNLPPTLEIITRNFSKFSMIIEIFKKV